MTSVDWNQLAKVLGVSVPEAHQKAAALAWETSFSAGGQAMSLGEIVKLMESQAGAAPSQTGLREGAEKNYGYSSKEWAALSDKQKADTVKNYVNAPNSEHFSAGTVKQVDAASKAGSADPVKLPSPEKAAAATATPTPSPYEQLANAVAGQYLQQIQQLQNYTSGGAAPGLSQAAASGASADIAALAPGSSVGGAMQAFLKNTPQAPMQGAVNNAMGQEAEAQAAGAVPYAAAAADSGVANAAAVEAGPWQQILSELASSTAYKAASQGAGAFGATTQNTPPWLQQIFATHGLAVPATTGSPLGLSTPGAPAKASKGGAAANSTLPTSSGSPATP